MAGSAQIISVPSPVGGLNVYDSLANMPITDAVALENMVPQPYGCAVRKGYALHADGMGALSVNTIAEWPNVDGATDVFAWADTSMYDVTTAGTVGAAVVTGLTNSWWQTILIGNSAGVHLLAFNGVDDPIWHSSAGTQRLTAGDGIVVGTWANVDPANLIQATIHQRRVWAVEVDTTFGWYLDNADAVYGPASYFDFGPFFKRGGYLTCLYTWTVDAGEGSDDLLVAISSKGEVVVFGGIDVTDPTQWKLIGVYFIGAPVRGRRFGANVSGDLVFVTKTGLVSMSAQVTSTKINGEATKILSTKVQHLLSDLTADLGSLDGWEIKFFPAINLLYINIPSVYEGGSGQLVMNVINQAWCTFSGMDAATFSAVASYPYFGGTAGKMYRSWYGTMDNVAVDGTGGTNILTYARQAYSYVGAPAAQKQIGMYRVNFLNRIPIGYAADIDYDFNQEFIPFPSPVVPGGSFDLWNFGLWNQAHWTGSARPQREWRQAEGIGVAASLAMRTTSTNDFTWVSTDYTYKVGGPL